MSNPSGFATALCNSASPPQKTSLPAAVMATFMTDFNMATVKRRGEEGVGEGEVTGFARYTRSKAHFLDDYASLGLKMLLHVEDFTVWPMS